MRKLVAVILWSSLFTLQVPAQTQKTHREDAGLKGTIETITVEKSSLSNVQGEWAEDKRQTTYIETYDPFGNLSQRRSFDYRGNLRDKTQYTFIDGEKVAKTESFRYDYDPPLQVAPPSQEKNEARDPRFNLKYKYRYDAKGNRVEMTIYYNNGARGTTSISEFDERGNRIKLDIYSSQGIRSYSRSSAYDSQGNETEATHFRSDGTVSSKYSYSDYEFDSEGNWTKRKTSKQVTKEGKPFFEPYEMNYRTITYYKGIGGFTRNPDGKGPPDRKGPNPLNRPRPNYTDQARRNKVEGTVRARVLIGEDGKVHQVIIIRGLPDGLNEEATRAAYKLKFKPATIKGKPTKSWSIVDIDFKLRSSP